MALSPAERLVLAEPCPLLFVLSGPSGVGKDAIINALRQQDAPRHYAITATTRPPRPGEQDGVHYHFFSVNQFQELLKRDGFLEWAKVYENYYGVPKFELRRALARGLDIILKVDVQGAATIKRMAPQAILIFIAPQNLDELLQRQRERGAGSAQDLEVRLSTAPAELDAIDSFDYMVVNRQGELATAVAQVSAIIQAEKCRIKRHPLVL